MESSDNVTIAFDDDQDEFEIDLDTSLATIKENKFRCEIREARLHKKETDEGVKLSLAVNLQIKGGPYNKTFVSDYIGLDMAKPFNAKKLTNFIESLTGERLSGPVRAKFQRDSEGVVQLAGAVGEEIGAFVASNDAGYVNVTIKGYLPISVFDELVDDEPF
jgi:hypothetical protein